jgi:hypothetical protein
MGWSETHRRWQVLRELETELNRTDGPLPWNEEYAGLFGDPATLLALLRYRWQLAHDAQDDPYLTEDLREEQQRRLARRFAGVRRILQRYADGGLADVAA